MGHGGIAMAFYRFTREDATEIFNRFEKLFDGGVCPHARLCETVEECFRKDLNRFGGARLRASFLYGWLGKQRVVWTVRDGPNRGLIFDNELTAPPELPRYRDK